jgi:hypothetical protein
MEYLANTLGNIKIESDQLCRLFLTAIKSNDDIIEIRHLDSSLFIEQELTRITD